jgi:hypothetical protein
MRGINKAGADPAVSLSQRQQSPTVSDNEPIRLVAGSARSPHWNRKPVGHPRTPSSSHKASDVPIRHHRCGDGGGGRGRGSACPSPAGPASTSPADVDRSVLKRLLTRFVHTIEPGIQLASPQWSHLWLQSPAISKAWEGLRPGLRPPQNVGAVTADPRVDDLESERAERHRGFESLRFRVHAEMRMWVGVTSMWNSRPSR